MLRDELEYAGYSVTISENFRSLLKRINGGNPDLVILDPAFNDFGALDLRRRLGNATDDVPVILWTGMPDRRGEARALDPEHVVAKQADLNELKSRMRMVLDSVTHPASHIEDGFDPFCICPLRVHRGGHESPPSKTVKS